ncbi:hypothetical protein Pmar_PMAR007061 [Perkinsus marinus ATCC 50983]|uniref:Uncharacterized protein n=1 Tax=Perkinsus marinus (strain ATCC 50983 / TXsc) TaxID=423536 RepID=C5KZN6_PERM5|nr:hypothetical protein Pmar_PMAR007061 [Perkinsus marinus ATCC 50983]EER10064.1 hypothetical protein Pmar_PMAR007061 [Perkinsus marinus ATCC 50983]|eukprot:XP_002778269.1 hypothetical protein Pmar_PMAR007061 [Perkinsus marinus ATCC 50983]
MGLIVPKYCDGSVVTGAIQIALHAPLMSTIQFLKLRHSTNYWLAAYLSISGSSQAVAKRLDLSPKGSFILKLGTIAAGCGSGAMNGLFSIGGPPNMIFVLLTNPDPLCWRGTSATMNVVIHVFTRLPVLLAGSLFDDVDLCTIVVLNLGAVCGLMLGNQLSRYVSLPMFRASIDLVLVVSSFMMTPLFILVPLLGVATLWVVFKLALYEYRKRRNYGEEVREPLLP